MPPKPKQPTLPEMIAERNQLMLNGSNPTRLAELKAKIDWIMWGILPNDKK